MYLERYGLLRAPSAALASHAAAAAAAMSPYPPMPFPHPYNLNFRYPSPLIHTSADINVNNVNNGHDSNIIRFFFKKIN